MAQMNGKRFVSLASDLVVASIESRSPHAHKIIEHITKRVKEIDNEDTIKVEDEIIKIIDSVHDETKEKNNTVLKEA